MRTDVGARSTSVRNSTSEIGIDSADVLDFRSDSADVLAFGSDSADSYSADGRAGACILVVNSTLDATVRTSMLAFGSDSADVLALGSDTSH